MRKIVYENHWLEVIEKDYQNQKYYAVSVHDYVMAVVEKDNKFLVIEEYRPIIDKTTLGFPSGMIDSYDTPQTIIHNEIIEETGYKANSLMFLGKLKPDVGRLYNNLWCYYTNDITEIGKPEPGVLSMKFMDIDEIHKNIETGMFIHSLTLSCFYLALKYTGRIKT